MWILARNQKHMDVQVACRGSKLARTCPRYFPALREKDGFVLGVCLSIRRVSARAQRQQQNCHCLSANQIFNRSGILKGQRLVSQNCYVSSANGGVCIDQHDTPMYSSRDHINLQEANESQSFSLKHIRLSTRALFALNQLELPNVHRTLCKKKVTHISGRTCPRLTSYNIAYHP